MPIRKKSRTQAKEPKSSVFPAQIELSGWSSERYRLPVNTDQPVKIANPFENFLFQWCCELYRLIDTLRRQGVGLIEAYSRYHSRHQFGDALQSRYFELDAAVLAQIDPSVSVRLLTLFNLLHELRVSLSITDSLPHTLQEEIAVDLCHLIDGWDELRLILHDKYGWSFHRIEQ